MAQQRTRWRPDTCACVIDYEWDDDAPIEAREHVPVAIEACPIHPSSDDLVADMATVLAHNRAANASQE